MKKIEVSFLVGLFFFLVACEPSTRKEIAINNCGEIKEGNLPIQFSRTISLNNRQYDHQARAFWSDLNEVLYFGLNKAKNCIDIYDVGNEKILKELCLKTDGSEGSIKVDEVIVHNLDSIFLFSEQEFKVHLINFDGVLVDHYNLQLGKINDWYEEGLTAGIEYIITKPKYDPIHKCFILPSSPQHTPDDEAYFQSPNLIVYDIVKHEYKAIGGAIPSEYDKLPKSLIEEIWWVKIVHSFGLDSILVSYYGSHKAVMVNMTRPEASTEICRKSDMMGAFEDIIHADGSMDQRKFVIETPYYANMIYHPQKQKFITQTKHRQPYMNTNGKINIPANAGTSIIVQNKALTEAFEVRLNEAYYTYNNNLFLYKEGVVLLRNNYESVDFNENLMIFDFYEL